MVCIEGHPYLDILNILTNMIEQYVGWGAVGWGYYGQFLSRSQDFLLQRNFNSIFIPHKRISRVYLREIIVFN